MTASERIELIREPFNLVASQIGNLPKAREAIDYALASPEFLLALFDGYTDIIKMIPGLTLPELSIMPSTRILLTKLGIERDLPTPEEMIRDTERERHCTRANRDLAKKMWRAEENRQTPGKYQSDRVIYFGTLVQTPEAFIVGAMGHAMERWVVASIRPRRRAWTTSSEAKNRWAKDDVLHSFNELVMLQKLKGTDNPLFSFFIRKHHEGGLNWISPEHFADFSRGFALLHSNG